MMLHKVLTYPSKGARHKQGRKHRSINTLHTSDSTSLCPPLLHHRSDTCPLPNKRPIHHHHGYPTSALLTTNGDHRPIQTLCKLGRVRHTRMTRVFPSYRCTDHVQQLIVRCARSVYTAVPHRIAEGDFGIAEEANLAGEGERRTSRQRLGVVIRCERTLRLPSAVMRRRLHVPQKWSVMLEGKLQMAEESACTLRFAKGCAQYIPCNESDLTLVTWYLPGLRRVIRIVLQTLQVAVLFKNGAQKSLVRDQFALLPSVAVKGHVLHGATAQRMVNITRAKYLSGG